VYRQSARSVLPVVYGDGDEDEISEEGRNARFERWHKLIGDPPAVRELAWEWVLMKEAEQSKGVIEAMGLSTSPALDAMGLKTPSWSTSLDEALSGEGPGSLKYALQSSDGFKDTTGGNTSSSVGKLKQEPEPAGAKPSAEILLLKPAVYGVGIDLKEAARRIRAWFSRRRGKSS
jgi:hypothetical protein